MDASAQTSTNPPQGTSNKPGIAAPQWTAHPINIAPGLFLTIAIAAAAFGLRAIPGLSLASPMMLAIAIGIAINAMVGAPVIVRAGIVFVLRRILRLAIILLGLQLTAGQIFAVGATGIGIILATLIATFAFTVWFGRVLGVERGLTELIAAGTSICGASAIIATNTVTRARSEDAAYAVACVTVFGSIAMFAYPILGAALGLESHAYGLWAGASIHEVAQVLAAAFQGGPEGEPGDAACYTRLRPARARIRLTARTATPIHRKIVPRPPNPRTTRTTPRMTRMSHEGIAYSFRRADSVLPTKGRGSVFRAPKHDNVPADDLTRHVERRGCGRRHQWYGARSHACDLRFLTADGRFSPIHIVRRGLRAVHPGGNVEGSSAGGRRAGAPR